jgi:hypothetical protein
VSQALHHEINLKTTNFLRWLKYYDLQMSGIHVPYDILVILMWLMPLAQVWTRLGNCSNWEQKHDDKAQIVKKIIQVLNEFSLTKVIQNSISSPP